MILTLTPNPSLDRTIEVERLDVGQVHRALSQRVDPGGKGVNVSRAVAAHGHATLALLPGLGAAATQFGALLDEAAVAHLFVPLADAVRTNITVVEADGTTTKINETGRLSRAADEMLLLDAVAGRLDGAHWLVGSGSLPPGMAPDFYVRLIEVGHTHGARVAVDTSGEPLALAAKAGPDLIKPNREELEEFVESSLDTVGEVVEAARRLVNAGAGIVAVSLGAEGAVAVSATDAAFAWSDPVRPLSTVGAGDCLLAGMLAALDGDEALDNALGQGVRWGTAAVTLPGSRVPSPADVRGVAAYVSRDLPLDQALSTPSQPARGKGR